MCVQRPIHVSTGITRTSWYRLMRPVKEKNNSIDGFEVWCVLRNVWCVLWIVCGVY